MKIKNIHAYEIISSGGYPTIETQLHLDDGSIGTASVPYGASAGIHEASILLDHDPSRWGGRGVLTAIKYVEDTIFPAIKDLDPSNQRLIDQTMIDLDGTDNKSKLGGNAILSVSSALAKAVAHSLHLPLYRYLINSYQTKPDLSHLPQPMVVMIEGGKHAHDTTDLQEYCLAPLKHARVETNLRMILETYHALGDVLSHAGLSTNVGHEGAYAPSGIKSNEAPLEFLVKAMDQAGYKPGIDLAFSLDLASSEFYHDGLYHLKLENRAFTAKELQVYLEAWINKYPFISLEDPFSQDDWANWPHLKALTDQHKVALIGDDLTVTNLARLTQAVEANAISSILIKPNQVGTLTQTIDTCLFAKEHGLSTVTSHRGGGETDDSLIVDLAVAVGSAFIKVGPTRGERVAKYNRLLAIERELL